MSMDFEAEAHELRWAWGSGQMLTTHPGHLASFEVCLADALKRAYAAGQRDMQERAAASVETTDELIAYSTEHGFQDQVDYDATRALIVADIRALEVEP